MKKTIRRVLSLTLALCLVMVMAFPVSASDVTYQGSYNGYGYVAENLCGSEYYYCSLGTTSPEYIKIKAHCYYKVPYYDSDGKTILGYNYAYSNWEETDPYVTAFTSMQGGHYRTSEGAVMIESIAKYYFGNNLAYTCTATP